MRLVLFRSLLATNDGGGDATTAALVAQITQMVSTVAEGQTSTPNNSEYKDFQGIDVDSSQVNQSLLELCVSQNLQLLCRIRPQNITDASQRLEYLSSQLTTAACHDDAHKVAKVMSLVVMEQPTASSSTASSSSCSMHDTAYTLSYLSHVLPMAAQFLEAHPTIGQAKGERNAHGNPLNTHVMGVCHRLLENDDIALETFGSKRQLLERYLEILDVLPPTRLSWNVAASQIPKNSNPNNQTDSNFDDDEYETRMDMEPLIQSVDHFDLSNYWSEQNDSSVMKQSLQEDSNQNNSSNLILDPRRIWDWQQGVHVQETYASCRDVATAKHLQALFLEKYNNDSTCNR